MTMSLATANTLANLASRGNLKALRDLLLETAATAISFLSGLTAGTVTASQGVVVDASKNIGTFGTVTATLFAGALQITRATVAAAGTAVGSAAALVAGFNSVTGADGTKGVVLPTAPVAGTIVIVKSVTGGSVLKVYPDAAATINAIGSNGAISMASLTCCIFIADSTTQWYTLPLLPS